MSEATNPVVVRFCYVRPEKDYLVNRIQYWVLGTGVLHAEIIMPKQSKRITVNLEEGLKIVENYYLEKKLPNDHKASSRVERYFLFHASTDQIRALVSYVLTQQSVCSEYDQQLYYSFCFTRVLPSVCSNLLVDESKHTCVRLVYNALRADTVALIDPEHHTARPNITPGELLDVVREAAASEINESEYHGLFPKYKSRHVSQKSGRTFA